MEGKFFVVADNIRSLENIGSIFRTSEALKVDKIFLCGISGKPPQAKISKSALGAEEIVPFEYHSQTARLIKKIKKPPYAKASEGQGRKIFIVALENNIGKDKKSIVYTKFKPKFPLALVVGNEVKGISKRALKLSDKIIYLPMQGKKESLNVAVAFGIAAYQISRFIK